MSAPPTRAPAVAVAPMETRREVITALAVRAEQLGYSGFFVAEGWGHDSTVLLADIARLTSTIRIGTGVLNVWGRSAATIAMSAVTPADISGGSTTSVWARAARPWPKACTTPRSATRCTGWRQSPGRFDGSLTATGWTRRSAPEPARSDLP